MQERLCNCKLHQVSPRLIFVSARVILTHTISLHYHHRFSIGLFHLNPDGTTVLKNNGSGEIAETYTNEDIMTLSRVWTNFHRRAERPNLEVYSDFYAGKWILTIFMQLVTKYWSHPILKVLTQSASCYN